MWRFLLRVTSVRFYLKGYEGKTQSAFTRYGLAVIILSVLVL